MYQSTNLSLYLSIYLSIYFIYFTSYLSMHHFVYFYLQVFEVNVKRSCTNVAPEMRSIRYSCISKWKQNFLFPKIWEKIYSIIHIWKFSFIIFHTGSPENIARFVRSNSFLWRGRANKDQRESMFSKRNFTDVHMYNLNSSVQRSQ